MEVDQPAGMGWGEPSCRYGESVIISGAKIGQRHGPNSKTNR